MLFSAWDQASIMQYGAFAGNPDKKWVTSLRSADPGAPAWEMEPWMALTSYGYRQEHAVPLWNQYSGCGAPYLANMQAQVLYPLTALFCLRPSAWTHDLYCLVRLFVSGLLAFFALRQYSRPSAAMLGAVCFMLTGYQLIYAGMPEISVSIVLPLLMLGTELVVRTRSSLSITVCSIGVALTLLGGMPELAFVQLLFAGLYALTRIAFLDNGKGRASAFAWLAGSYMLGLLLAAPQVFTFLEFMTHSTNVHDTKTSHGWISGIRAQNDWIRGLSFYLLPSSHKANFIHLVHGFCGVVTGGLGLLGSFYGIQLLFANKTGLEKRVVSDDASRGPTAGGNETDRSTAVITCFFAVASLFMLLKQFGCPLVNWIGYLPVLRMVYFDKYDQPLIAFCLSALAAIAVSAACKRQLRIKTVAITVVVAAIAFAALIVSHGLVPHNDFWDSHRNYLNAIYVSIGLLVSTFMAVFAARRWPRLSLAVLISLVSINAYHGYLGRAYAAANLPPRKADPYQGAPYVYFLRRAMTGNERSCATSYLFMPEWSGAFQINDTRTIDGLFPANYLPFIRNQFPDDVCEETQGILEAWEWFFGGEFTVERMANDPQERAHSLHKLMALTSAKYLVTPNLLPDVPELSPEVQMSKWIGTSTNISEHVLNGKKEKLLMQQPSVGEKLNAVRYFIVIPKDATKLSFGLVRNAVDRSLISHAGVHFNLDVIPHIGGKAERVFSAFLISKNSSQESESQPFAVDLSKYGGRRVQLAFSVSAAPKTCWPNEWVAWDHFAWHTDAGSPPAPVIPPGCEKLVYDGEVKIYELSPVLARATLFRNVSVLKNGEAIKAAMHGDGFDPFASVLIDGTDVQRLTPVEKTALASITRDLPAPAVPGAFLTSPHAETIAATVVSSTSRGIKIKCSAQPEPTLLLLTDTYYPGWRAYVDGKPATILNANFAFRGIVVPANSSSVEFVYDPSSYKYGLWAATFAALSLLAIAVVRRRSS